MNKIKIVSVVFLIMCFDFRCFAQDLSRYATLLQQLQAAETTDDASKEWLKLAKSDPSAKQYLAAHLSSLIEKVDVHYGMVDSKSWKNSVQLAGELQLVEVAPVLAKWLSVNTNSSLTTGLSQGVRLEDNLPGKALAQIGDPSIPALKEVLNHGTQLERLRAIYVLKVIASPQAKSALAEHLDNEPDQQLKDFIQRIISKDAWGKAS